MSVDPRTGPASKRIWRFTGCMHFSCTLITSTMRRMQPINHYICILFGWPALWIHFSEAYEPPTFLQCIYTDRLRSAINMSYAAQTAGGGGALVQSLLVCFPWQARSANSCSYVLKCCSVQHSVEIFLPLLLAGGQFSSGLVAYFSQFLIQAAWQKVPIRPYTYMLYSYCTC